MHPLGIAMPARWALIAVFAATLAGCRSGFERYYVPQSLGESFPPVENSRVIEVGTQDPTEVRSRLYPDATLIGTSRFVAGHESRDELAKFAATIGSDLALWRLVWLGTETTSGYRSIPRSDTTHVRTKGPDGQPVVTQVQTTSTDIIPYVDTRAFYEHEVLFLRASP